MYNLILDNIYGSKNSQRGVYAYSNLEIWDINDIFEL